MQATNDKLRVIVADDKKAANTIISGTLQLQGFEVYSVTNAMECLNRLDMEKGQIDAIYLEGKIASERSGMIIPRIKQINPKTKIVVIVDDQQRKEEVEKLEPDFVSVLPTNVTAIADIVKALLIQKLHSSS